jgi:hypothetical protein
MKRHSNLYPAITAFENLLAAAQKAQRQKRYRYGARFVGFRVFPDRIRVRNYNLQMGRIRLKRLQAAYDRGELSAHDMLQSLQSWNAHLAHGDTWRLRQQIFRTVPTNPLE